ncbi:deoxyribodipyrimidine photo-lyase [Dyadobacter frigoris]|uniref:DASH family cryptochrome n=1 Tax=Dyadobacter frigoris TaxID=2576211 RepID=UPI0024A2B66E|nr:DASH family cryptochrome [Dyadobacter frigoris]GLU55169.1 deoxyribodipyrimidine photo-lyase [Dyadobacter frigoris]
MRRAIVWFRKDLRLHDNETLVRAIQQNDEIVPVYCVDETELINNEWDLADIKNFRRQFLLESLLSLDAVLREKGSGLIVVMGKPDAVLVELALHYRVQKVYAQKEDIFQEIQIEEAVEKELWKINVVFNTFNTSTLYHGQDLPFATRDLPDTFNQFKRRIEQDSEVRAIFDEPELICSPAFEQSHSLGLQDFGINCINKKTNYSFWEGGEKEGLHRLRTYLAETHSLPTYKKNRIGMVCDDSATKLSSWLSLGCISPRLIYHELKKRENRFSSNETGYWLLLGLIRRDYYRFMAKKYVNKWSEFMEGLNYLSGMKNEDHKRFSQWINGQTGVEKIDMYMTELKFTGFLTNVGKKTVSKFLINVLEIDWRWGAIYFQYQLIDYDIYSNWGNWADLGQKENASHSVRFLQSK